MTIRDDMVALAASYVGCGEADDPERFEELVAPGEEPDRAHAMATKDSTCGLAVRGWLGQLGLQDDRLQAPYKDGRVMIDLNAMAHEAHALTSLLHVQPGDIVLLAGPEHALVVESVDGSSLSTIQGGEQDKDHGMEQIQRIPRQLTGIKLGGRSIELVISLAPLAAHFTP